MEQQYAVSLNDRQIGKVCVMRSGLYYSFHCRCSLPEEGIYRLMICSGSTQKSLGILVPVEDEFGLDTRLPIKQLGEGMISFHVIPKKEARVGTFVPIRAEEPFTYIASLKASFLILKDQQHGIQV